MCGIYGEMSFGPAIPSWRVKEAATILRHRGVDDEGYLVASTTNRTTSYARGSESVGGNAPHIDSVSLEEADVMLAFRRLAIVDLSPAGAQPMGSRDGLCWIVFNGEIYNHIELRAQLFGLGHVFSGHSDTEILLAAYREWGVDCVHHFNGMWSFCILDLTKPDTPFFLSRDRFGEKPLFFERTVDGFRFASEAKALVVRSKGGFRPDSRIVANYLAYGTMPSATAGETFFEGIEQLPPASCLLLGKRSTKQWRYWSLPDPTETVASLVEATQELRKNLNDSVRLRLRADVAVGTCLSGGLDSSAIVTTIAAIGGPQFDQQHTFTAAYDSPGRHDEREYVEKVLAVLNAVPTLSFPTVDGLQLEMDDLTWHQDEPFGSSSIYAQWCVMRSAAEQGVRVILDGQGADELFGGYRPFAYSIADKIRRGKLAAACTELSILRAELGMPKAPLFLKAIGLAGGVHNLPAIRHQLRRFRSAPPVLADGVELRRPPASPLPGRSRDLLDSHLRRVTLESSLPELLRYEDRNSMAHGVESRTPFLDFRLAECAFGSSAAHRSSAPWTKYVLRRAVQDRVPSEIVWRKEKVGFETPEVLWRPIVRTMLADRLSGNPAADLIDAKACMTDEVDDRSLWRAMNLAAWWQVFRKAAVG